MRARFVYFSSYLGSLTAANWVSFDFNVSYSSCWGYSLINTFKLVFFEKRNHAERSKQACWMMRGVFSAADSQLRAIRGCYGTCWVCLILQSSSYYSACAGVVRSFVSSTPRSSCMWYVSRASYDASATCVPPFSCHMQHFVNVCHVIISFLLVAVPLLFLMRYLRAWLVLSW